MHEKSYSGCGISGLGAYYANKEAHIYEASEHAEGICNGFVINDFYFDQAVHFTFTENEIVRKVFDRTEQYYHYPQPYCWYMESWLHHPAQNNLYPFSPKFKVAAVKGFLQRNGRECAEDFKAWLIGGYGKFYMKIYIGRTMRNIDRRIWKGWEYSGLATAYINRILLKCFMVRTLIKHQMFIMPRKCVTPNEGAIRHILFLLRDWRKRVVDFVAI